MDKELEKLRKKIQQETEQYNNTGTPDFEMYSPLQMGEILYRPFEANSPLSFKEADKAVYEQIPILQQIRYLMELIHSQAVLKLTAKGNLPVKVVKDIYNQGFIKDDFIEKGTSKLGKERDVQAIHLTHLLLQITRLVKKRNNKLSLTTKGLKMLLKEHKFFQLVFTTFATQFNWGYFDGYNSDEVGQFGMAFSLILLNKYGEKERPTDFYADKYFQALPALIDDIPESVYRSKKEVAFNCYNIRTFDRFLSYFKLIEGQKKGIARNYSAVKTTALFNELFTIKAP